MPTAEKSGNWFKRHKIITGILAFIILCIIVSATGGGKQNKTTPTPTATTNTSKTTTTATAANKVSQSAAENYCQDAGLLGKYIDLSNTSIIYITDYNEHYTDSGEQASNGDEIWDLQWDGKDKTTKEPVGFVCMVSGTDKSITLHDLAINGTAVYGPVDEKQ